MTMKTIDTQLQKHGLRPTRIRKLILDLLYKIDGHYSAQEITDILKARGDKVGTATVYQNLEKLFNVSLIRRIAGADGLKRYDGDLTPHHHLECVSCGTLLDINLDHNAIHQLLPQARSQDKPVHGWTAIHSEITIKAICPSCQRSS